MNYESGNNFFSGLETGNRFFPLTGFHDYFLDWYPLPGSRVSILKSGYQ